MKAVIYTRVSSSGQEDGTSLATQYAMCMHKAQDLGISVVAHFEEVHSGAAYLGRGKLQSALELIEQGKAEAIIFYALDRFSRDSEHQETIKKRIERAGGKLIFCTQQFDDTPEGDLMFGVSGNFAAYLRKIVRRGCINGHRELLKNGITPVRNYRAFGYEIIKTRDPKGRPPGTFEIIESEASNVRKMFDLYASGKSLSHVVRWLHAQKVPTARGGLWRSATVRAMLINTIYKGKFAYGKNRIIADESRIERGFKSKWQVPVPESEWIYIDVPAIVSEEVFDAVQQRMKNFNKRGGRNDRKFMLTSLLICAGCGKRLMGSKGYPATSGRHAKKPNYTCEKHDALTPKCTYAHRYFIAPDLESHVIETITYLAGNPHLLHSVYDNYVSAQKQSPKSSEVEGLRKELAELKKREKALIESQISAKMAGSKTTTYDELILTTSERYAFIESAIQELQIPLPSQESIIKPFENFTDESIEAIKAVLSSPDIPGHEKNALVSGVIHHIIPIAKNHVKIYFRNEKGFYIVATWMEKGIKMEIEQV